MVEIKAGDLQLIAIKLSPKAKVSKTNPKRQQIKGTNIFPLTIFKLGNCQRNYSAIMNVDYQELINVILWQKGSK